MKKLLKELQSKKKSFVIVIVKQSLKIDEHIEVEYISHIFRLFYFWNPYIIVRSVKTKKQFVIRESDIHMLIVDTAVKQKSEEVPDV